MSIIIGFAGNGHLMEHSAAAAFAKGFQRITYTPIKTGDDVRDLSKCDIVYICPDRPSNTSPQAMVDLVLPHLKIDAVLVIYCQVTPGFTNTVNWPNHMLYYQVETLRMKDAEERALNPDRIILGHCGKGFLNVWLQQFLGSFGCPLLLMSYEAAEIAKIAINIYLAAQVSTTNTLSELADKMGVDWKEVIPALQTDSRIGTESYLQPGYGLSKHLIRDLQEIQKFGVNTDVTDSFLKHSEYRRNMLTNVPKN